jgi:hypothetical protein
VVENVCGAQKWVGRARWHFGSFYLWGDVPALMPIAFGGRKGAGLWFGDYAAMKQGIKQGGDWFNASQPSISRMCSSKSTARKAASAHIAKIPLPLSQWIAAAWKPTEWKHEATA